MKFTPKQYAAMLYEATRNRSEKEAETVIQDFAKLLIKTRSLHLLPRIVEVFRDYYNKQEKIIELTVQIAKSTPKGILKDLQKKIPNFRVEIKEKITPTILGGIILKWNDIVIDASIDTKLNQLKRKLSQ